MLRAVLQVSIHEHIQCRPSTSGYLDWRHFAAVAGPGLVVMLADTDAGSIITAAQSGAEWGYGLLLLQFILVPILFMVQELTVRLGIVTRKGHAELIRDQFGRGWAWLSVGTLVISCIGALLERAERIGGRRPADRRAGARHHDAGRRRAHRSWRIAAHISRSSGSRSRSGCSRWCFWRSPGGHSPVWPRSRRRLARHRLARSELSLSGRRQYRRRDHALDGVLPAIVGGGKEAHDRRPAGGADWTPLSARC